eukprot:73456-Pelagomonas_calceolata.AAC.1
MSDLEDLVKPNGTGITNTTGRAKLAAFAAALTHTCTYVATDSLRAESAHILNSENKSNVQRRTGIMHKEISHAGVSLKGINLTNSGIPSAGPGGNPF